MDFSLFFVAFKNYQKVIHCSPQYWAFYSKPEMAIFGFVKFQVWLKSVNISFEPEFGNPRFGFQPNLILKTPKNPFQTWKRPFLVYFKGPLFSLFFSDNYLQFFLIRAKTEEELEAQRQQRMEEAVRKELEKANKPKRPVAPKKTEWEVEMIKGIKNLGLTPWNLSCFEFNYDDTRLS